MRPSDRFTLAELPVWHPLRAFKRRLLCDGQPTDALLLGYTLAVQYESDGVFLLVTQYDHFEAVTHWFYVITREGRILDRASTPDYFGFLERAAVEEPGTLAFGFYGTNDQWRVQIRRAGIWSFAWLELRLRLNEFLPRKRYISFQRQQGAPWAAK